MASLMNILLKPLQYLIHKDFRGYFQRMSLIDKLLFLIVHFVDMIGIGWHRLPVLLGLTYLLLRRHLYQEYNLFYVGNKPFNDPSSNRIIAASGSFFGRNILPLHQTNKLMKPDPMVVATKLFARRKFIDTGKQFNMIAASWIQFMIHDWVDHLENTHDQQVEVRAPEEVASQCPLKSFRFYKTKEFETNNSDNGIKTGYLNIRTPWCK